MLLLMNTKKCKTCPYKLGLVKCIIVSPCPACRKSKSKKHPFPEAIIKSKKMRIEGC